MRLTDNELQVFKKNKKQVCYTCFGGDFVSGKRKNFKNHGLTPMNIDQTPDLPRLKFRPFRNITDSYLSANVVLAKPVTKNPSSRQNGQILPPKFDFTNH
jgi:hypothetical protein